MKQLLWKMVCTCGLLAAAIPQNSVEAQTLTIGRGGVHYNGYGQGYYGGRGRGYNSYYSGNNHGHSSYFPRSYNYSGYGNGTYGYGYNSSRTFPSYNGYNYGNTTYYNGYAYPSYSGYYGQYYGPTYGPFGYSIDSSTY